MSMTDASAMVATVAKEGGAIVSASACSELEVMAAVHAGRFYTDNTGQGFVIRSQQWLERAHAALLKQGGE